jgi:uncharacterized protein (TIGR02246 family)
MGSGGAFAEAMTDDVDFVAFDGSHFKGKQEVVAFHDPLFKTYLTGSRLIGSVIQVRFLSDSVALMHARGGTIMRGQKKASPARDSIQTLVAVRNGEHWAIRAFQNTRVRPIGRNHAGTIVWLLSDWIWKYARSKDVEIVDV